MASLKPVRLGILSTANIGLAVLEALKSVPTCTCTVVASRNLEKAKSFATDNGIETGCTYEELLQQPLDAVYIPLPTALAADWAIRCASAGFHVLVDKPFSSAEDVQRIIDACTGKGVFLMDATHFVHAPRTARVKEMIREGVVGDIKRLVSVFTLPIAMAGNIRSDPALEPAGALGDLGWYVMKTAVTFLGTEKASKIQSVSCQGRYHPDFPGVIESAEGVIVLGGGDDDRVTLDFVCDCSCATNQSILMLGKIAQIDVPEFMAPFAQTDILIKERKPEDYHTDAEIGIVKAVSSFDSNGDPVKCYPTREVETVKEPGGLSQASLMMKEFSRMIHEKDEAAAKQWAIEALTTQKLVDAAFEQIKK